MGVNALVIDVINYHNKNVYSVLCTNYDVNFVYNADLIFILIFDSYFCFKMT